jgi:MoaA/NifB/PqqE/SkfB family radical SAM enzyme
MNNLKNEDIDKITLFWKGEPCLNPELPQIAQHADNLGYYTYTSTNMTVPNLSKPAYVKGLLKGLHKIELCIDGWNHHTLNQYRVGGNWKQLLKNLATIGKTPTDCIKEMRVLMFRYNEGKQPFFRKLARKHNVDIIAWGQPIINGLMRVPVRDVQNVMPKQKMFQRYVQEGDMWVHKSCETCAVQPLIDTWGDVYPCCYDRNMLHGPLGNVATDNVQLIRERWAKMVPIMRRRGWFECSDYCFIPFRSTVANIREDAKTGKRLVGTILPKYRRKSR